MSRLKKTKDITQARSKEMRQDVKLKILEALAESDKPMSVGQLFLKTGKGNGYLSVLLRELKDSGIIQGKTTSVYVKTYSGNELRHDVMLWSLVKKGSS